MQTNTTRKLTSREAAKIVNRSEVSLERWRRLRKGPPYLRVMGRVLYNAEDIANWLDAQRQDPEAQA